MAFPRGTYRWEAETRDGQTISRETGHNTGSLVPRDLKAFRLVSGGMHAINLNVQAGLRMNDLTLTGRLIEIRNTSLFDKITLTLRKEFPLSAGVGATTENYLVRATHPGGGLFIFVEPGRIIVTTTESDIPE